MTTNTAQKARPLAGTRVMFVGPHNITTGNRPLGVVVPPLNMVTPDDMVLVAWDDERPCQFVMLAHLAVA